MNTDHIRPLGVTPEAAAPPETRDYPRCEVCLVFVNSYEGRCTNGRCGKCHRLYCTSGGDTSPGHGRGTVETPYANSSRIPGPTTTTRTTDAQAFAIAEQARAIAAERDALRTEVANLREIANSALNWANELRAALNAIASVPAVLQALGMNHTNECQCPLCIAQALTSSESGERMRREGK